MRRSGSGGNGRLTVASNTVGVGTDVQIQGPANSVVIVTDMSDGSTQHVTLDPNGQAKLPAGNKPRVLALRLASDRFAWTTVQVVDT